MTRRNGPTGRLTRLHSGCASPLGADLLIEAGVPAQGARVQLALTSPAPWSPGGLGELGVESVPYWQTAVICVIEFAAASPLTLLGVGPAHASTPSTCVVQGTPATVIESLPGVTSPNIR